MSSKIFSLSIIGRTIVFTQTSNSENFIFQSDNEHLLIAAKLLGLEVPQLQKWLCHKVLSKNHCSIEWLVSKINEHPADLGMTNDNAKFDYNVHFLQSQINRYELSMSLLLTVLEI
jgi:hypothetical protein